MIDDLIRQRRATFVPMYDPSRPVERHIIERLLENANWAPTHRLTEPWRFKVFHSAESRAQLGDYLAGAYKNSTPADQFSEDKYRKVSQQPNQAAAVLVIVMQRDPEARVPEFEEIAAVSMAVQNMWLTCAEMGLGCYWSTPPTILEADEWLQLTPGQRCLGLFYLGWPRTDVVLPGKRTPVADKVTWI
jgi:nitroreductase